MSVAAVVLRTGFPVEFLILAAFVVIAAVLLWDAREHQKRRKTGPGA